MNTTNHHDIRCGHCGRFISLKDIEEGRVKMTQSSQRFDPIYTCPKCSNDEGAQP